ncbi:hypothetical protein ACFLYR_08770 [Chloroflexota bacterium]
MKDLTPEVVAAAGPLMEGLGKVSPTSFQILSEVDEGGSVTFKCEYIGASSSLKLSSTWREIEGIWKMVAGGPA